jgi:uncharacterized membrane protein
LRVPAPMTTTWTARSPLSAMKPARPGSASRRRVCLYSLGLGGFVYGIVLHQILQWHHIVSDVSRFPVNAIAGLVVNTFADEFFHLATWVLVLAASIARDQGLAAGTHGTELERPLWARPHWLGIFNVVEGLIDHQILGFHHVRDERLRPEAAFAKLTGTAPLVFFVPTTAPT